jgi:hypothetical protein
VVGSVKLQPEMLKVSAAVAMKSPSALALVFEGVMVTVPP